jgi:murein DD-endopeptidase MepM/ murein hydrolase activator NlpD
MKKLIKKILKEQRSKILLNEKTMNYFPVGSDNFNVGYDTPGLGSGVNPKVLDREDSIQNTDYSSKHKGIDIFGPLGEPVVAPVPGVVDKISKRDRGKGGLTITIKRDDGLSFYMAHLDTVGDFERGDPISAGQQVGTLGKTGNARGTHPHIHFSVYGPSGYFSDNRDPWPYLQSTLSNVLSGEGDDTYIAGEPDEYGEDVLEIWDGMSKGRKDKRSEVKEMQKLLIKRNYVLPNFGIDGKFGTETLAAVKAFQKDYMDEVTGKVTPEMMELLKQEENINQTPEMNDPTEVKKIIKKKDYKNFSPEVVDAISQASETHNVSYQVLLTIANIESGGNPSAYNRRSKASGLFQILPKYFNSYGVDSTTVWDPYINADAAANKLKGKMYTLTSFLGRGPTDAELYISHNQGTTGFKVIYTACENYGDLEGKESLQKAAIEMGYKKSYGIHIYNNMKGNKGGDPCTFLNTWNDIYASKQEKISHMV